MDETYIPETGDSIFESPKIPNFVRVGMEYGMITPGNTFDDYMLDAIFDPSGFECAVAHNQQGSGKSNFVMQRASVLAYERIKDDLNNAGTPREPTDEEIWGTVLDSIVFTPSDFVRKLEAINQDETERLDFVIWDDIQLEYTSSTFKTDIDQYAAIDSMFAVVRTKVSCVFITIPNITRLPKNVKDNITFEMYVGKNRKAQIRKIFRLPGQRNINSNLFKPIIQRSIVFDLFAIPAWAWKRYEGMRKNIADKALANLKGATNMEDMEGYITLPEAAVVVKDNGLRWGILSLQQMASRKIIKKQEIKGVMMVELVSLLAAVKAENHIASPEASQKDTS